MKKMLLMTGASLITCLSMGALQAEDSSGADKVEEIIVVTSRKKEENLFEIPLSVAVVNQKFIEEANLTSVADIARATPGFKLNSAFGRQGDRPVVRGVSGISTGVELAGYFVDGVYVSGSLQSFDLDSIARVEVLKGPQSAAFGRRTFAGAVNYVTQLPEDEMQVKLKADIGSNGHQVLGATVSGKTGIWGYRANLRSYDYDGDFENTLDIGPENVGGESTKSFNGTLYVTPSDATSIQWNVLYADDDDEQYAIALQRSSENNCSFTASAPGSSPRPYYCGVLIADTPISIGGFLPDEQYGVQQERLRTFVKVDHEFANELELSSITAYNKNNHYAGEDQTFGGLQTAFSFATFGQVPASEWHTLNSSTTDNFSQELWLRGQRQNFDWSLGAYYFDESEKDTTGSNGATSDVTNVAVMAGVDYDITDWFSAGLEVRLAGDEITQKPEGSTTEFNETFDSFTYRLTGSVDISDSSIFYGNVSTGTLPGAFNTGANVPVEFIPIDEGKLRQIEIGIKSQVNEKFDYTAALYNQKWEDQIRSQFIVVNGTPVGYQANQGTTDFQGFEFAANWRPTDRLTLTGAMSLNDSEVNDFISDDSTDVAITDGGDVSGAQLPLSPKKEYYAAASYDMPFSNGFNLVSRLDWSYQDSRFVRLTNQAETGDASILNATFTLDSGDNWRVSLWAKNLTDEDSPISALRYIEADSFFFGGRAFALTPRRGTEFGVTGTYTF